MEKDVTVWIHGDSESVHEAFEAAGIDELGREATGNPVYEVAAVVRFDEGVEKGRLMGFKVGDRLFVEKARE